MATYFKSRVRSDFNVDYIYPMTSQVPTLNSSYSVFQVLQDKLSYLPVRDFIMDGLVLNEPLLCLCLSLTSLLTAFVASKTLFSYQKHVKALAKKLIYHLEDWTLFIFTTAWLVSVNFPYGCFVVWRTIVGIYIKLRYGRLGDIATGLDSAGSVDLEGSRQIIKSLKVLKGKCDLETLRERVDATARKVDPKTGKLAHPKFHQYLSLCGGYYCWKPATYDINHHVRFASGLDETCESVSESKTLQIVSKISNEPFKEKRGLWEILVIPKFHYDHEESLKEDEREEKFAVVFRLSHGIGDGFSFLKLIMRDCAGANAEDYIPPSKPSKSPFWYKIFVFFYVLFKGPRAFYSEMKLKDCNPLHNPDIQITGEKVHLWSKPLNVEWLKMLKQKVGAGMSTILLESLSGGCRTYMMQKSSLPQSQLPKTFATMIPVPAPNHPDNELVNKFSIVMMQLELKTQNVLERCRLIEKQSRLMAYSPDSYMNLFLMDLVAVFPHTMSKWFILNTQCTSVISNLPGPKKAFSIWGYPVADTMFWLPNVGYHSGISTSYLSYENRLRIGLAVDTGVITDKEEGARLLLDWMIKDLQELAEAVELPMDDMFIHEGPKVEAQVITTPADVEEDIELQKSCIITDEDGTASSDDTGLGDDQDLSTEEDLICNISNKKKADNLNDNIHTDFLQNLPGKAGNERKTCYCSRCSNHPLIVSQTVRYRCLNGGRS